MSGKRTDSQSDPEHTSQGRADLKRLRKTSEAEIEATSPPELADLPNDFWDDAVVVAPQPELSLHQ